MTTREQIIAAAKECFDCLADGRGRTDYSADEYGIEKFYAIAFEAGRVAEREDCEKLATINRADLTAEAIRARGESK